MSKGKVDFEDLSKFGFRMLQTPFEALTMVYPSEELDIYLENPIEDNQIPDLGETNVGKRGLYNVMNFVDETNKPVPLKHSYSYKPEVLKKYGPIFREDILAKYSAKFSSIIKSIRKVLFDCTISSIVRCRNVCIMLVLPCPEPPFITVYLNAGFITPYNIRIF